MDCLTTKIVFQLDSRLNELATIEEDCNGLWGFTTNKGYNTWEGEPYKSFDQAYKSLKVYEKNSVADLKYS